MWKTTFDSLQVDFIWPMYDRLNRFIQVMLIRYCLFWACIVLVESFRSSVSLRKFHFSNRWTLKAYTIPVGGWTHTTFSLRERLPSDMKEATETKCDVSFWNNVQSAVDKIEAEGKKASDLVMLQIMDQCTVAHFAGSAAKVFNFSAIDYPPVASSSVSVGSASPTDSQSDSGSGGSTAAAELTAEEATNAVIESINVLGATSMKDMGKVMADVKPKLAGKFDSTKVPELVKKLLSAGPPFVPVAVSSAVAGNPATTAAAGELSPEDTSNLIIDVINSVGASSMRDMGKVMSEAKTRLAGRVDAGKIGELVKKLLSAGPPFVPATTQNIAAASNGDVDGSAAAAVAPGPLSGDELSAAVQEAATRLGATSMKDMGRLMADLKEKLAGKVDPGKLSEVVKKILTEGNKVNIEPVAVADTAAAAATAASAVVSPSEVCAPDGSVASPLTEEEALKEVQDCVNRVGATGMKDMGKVMSELRTAMQGKIEMNKLSEIVKKALSSNASGGASSTGGNVATSSANESLSTTSGTAATDPVVIVEPVVTAPANVDAAKEVVVVGDVNSVTISEPVSSESAVAA